MLKKKYNFKKKILITGSEGFLGTYLKNEFLKNNHQVVGLDNLSRYKKRSPVKYNKNNFKFFKVDCSNQSKVIKYIKDCDTVIINAAKIGGIKILNSGYSKLFNENHNIFIGTLSACIEAYKKYKLKKIIFISTSMIYENNGKKKSKEIDDHKIAYPKNFYAFQKLTAEMYLQAASQQHGFIYNIIRPFNLVGNFDYEKLKIMSHVVPELIKKIKNKDRKIKIYGDGLQERSFTSIYEAAKSIYLVSTKKICKNQVFNVGSEKSVNILKIINIISDRLKVKKRIVKTRYFKSDVKYNRCSSKKLFKYINYKPQKKITDIINDLI